MFVGADGRVASSPDQRYRRSLLVGTIFSVLVHGMLLVSFRADLEPLPGTVAAGPRAGGPRAAAGGGVMQALNVALPRRIEVPPPPARIPEFEAPDVDIRQPPEESLEPSVVLTGAAFSPGAGAQAGLLRGVGRGDAGADSEGRFRVTAPEPRSIIPEWNPPSEVKGMQVMVRVLVNERGQPLGRVELRPPTPNRGFNDRLRKKVLDMDYKPARRQGRPISGWAEMTFIF